MAEGVHWQRICVSRPTSVVIAVKAADREVTRPGISDRNLEMFRQIAVRL